MSALEILAATGFAIVAFVAVYIVASRNEIGSPALAAALSAGFATYSAATIYQEGVILVWTNHTTNMWGVQVWWDLLLAAGIALFFIVPRANKVGMIVPLWALFVVSTASIGLLAMCARLFWLENAAATQASSAKGSDTASGAAGGPAKTKA
ncbi:hypothetical protein [Erythrobacter sp. Alg231-14]|uniref:hypothetical protein n=1 Tax=Erythrobacter sp. Alg231-14 TaxID=1922225 RepID=UPI000D55DC86